MPQYLLKINKRKWDNLELPWLEPNEIQADPLGDLRISQGTLSVWHIEDDKSNLDFVITAIAATRQTFDKFEYGLFDQDIIDSVGLKTQITPGDTPFGNANTWHRDLVHLTIDKVSNLVKEIFGNLVKKRLFADDVRDNILNAVKDGYIDPKNVNKPLREVIIQLMGSRFGL